jgi:dTDP-4-amino-4,6-dideoxygalactose transaminase
MSEFQAALGLLQLKYYEHVSRSRRDLFLLYKENLNGIPGLSWLNCDNDVEYNFSYFPVKIEKVFLAWIGISCTKNLKRKHLYQKVFLSSYQ